LKNGVVPARLDDAACADLRRAITASPGLEIEVDLERQEIRAARQPVRSFVIDEFFRSMMLRGVDEVGFTLGLRGEIEAFERRYHTGNSWLAPG
jgi:3-isopropylmalate/(R)-2-methylmalate dehydratase small subunit